MRIESLSPIATRGLVAALPRLLSSIPSAEADAARAPARAPAAGAPMPTVQMLVVLAAADPGVERRRRLAVGAEKGLALLDALHRELIGGTAAPARLREIGQWAQTVEIPEEPALAAILRDIDLRVRVELAKLDIEI